MENGRAGKVKKKKKEAEDMEQELLQEIASYWGTRAEGYSEVNEKELAGSQREAWLHVLESSTAMDENTTSNFSHLWSKTCEAREKRGCMY